MIDKNRWWERVHRNGIIAKVSMAPHAAEYIASASDPREHGIDKEPVKTGLNDEEDAKAEADKLAHPDCDGSCTAWAAMP